MSSREKTVFKSATLQALKVCAYALRETDTDTNERGSRVDSSNEHDAVTTSPYALLVDSEAQRVGAELRAAAKGLNGSSTQGDVLVRSPVNGMNLISTNAADAYLNSIRGLFSQASSDKTMDNAQWEVDLARHIWRLLNPPEFEVVEYPDISIEQAKVEDAAELLQLYFAVEYRITLHEVVDEIDEDGEEFTSLEHEYEVGLVGGARDFASMEEEITTEYVLVARDNETGNIVGFVTGRWFGRGIDDDGMRKLFRKITNCEPARKKFYRRPQSFPFIGLMDRVAVSPNSRQNGVATRLEVALRDFFINALKMQSMVSSVIQEPGNNSESIAFHERLGWYFFGHEYKTMTINGVENVKTTWAMMEWVKALGTKKEEIADKMTNSHLQNNPNSKWNRG